jgi:hypothetical protein
MILKKILETNEILRLLIDLLDQIDDAEPTLIQLNLKFRLYKEL